MGRPSTLLLCLLTLPALHAQPRIAADGVVNAASFLPPATPGGAIARGAIISIFGEKLAPAPEEAGAFPLPLTLSGTQVRITVADGAILQAPLLYVSPRQINAILPSTVPAGRHLLRVEREGAPSNDQAVKVVAGAFGQFFAYENGVPVAVAHAATATSTWRVSLATPARPGSIVTLWGSGLGPAPDDRSPTAIASTARMEALLAGRPVTATYAGRASCCAGLDQVNIEVPEDAPTGCVIPLVVLVNGNVSNHTSLPVTADGAPCIANPDERSGRIHLVRQWTGEAARDQTSASFHVPLSDLDPARLPPVGSCMVWRQAATPLRWFDATTLLPLRPAARAGDALSLTSPSGTFRLTGDLYSVLDPASTTFLGPGAYAVQAPGETFPAFEAELQVNPAPVLEVLDPKDVWARTSPTSARWFGGDSEATGVLWTDPSDGREPDVVCRPSISEHSFQVPPYVWANQVPGPRIFAFGGVRFSAFAFPTDGPDHGLLVYREEYLQNSDLGPFHLASTPVTLPSGEVIQAELAVTAAERSRGLMQRPALARDKGMLFLFEADGLHTFWMLNTIIPLDIIWMNSDREILFISADTPPCRTAACPTYGPLVPSRYVLELSAGEAARRGLKPGDRLSW